MEFDTVFELILVCGGALIFTYWRGYVHGSIVRGDLDFDKMVSPHQDLTLGDVLKIIETFIATHHMRIEELVDRKKMIISEAETYGKSKIYTHKK